MFVPNLPLRITYNYAVRPSHVVKPVMRPGSVNDPRSCLCHMLRRPSVVYLLYDMALIGSKHTPGPCLPVHILCMPHLRLLNVFGARIFHTDQSVITHSTIPRSFMSQKTCTRQPSDFCPRCSFPHLFAPCVSHIILPLLLPDCLRPKNTLLHMPIRARSRGYRPPTTRRAFLKASFPAALAQMSSYIYSFRRPFAKGFAPPHTLLGHHTDSARLCGYLFSHTFPFSLFLLSQLLGPIPSEIPVPSSSPNPHTFGSKFLFDAKSLLFRSFLFFCQW